MSRIALTLNDINTYTEMVNTGGSAGIAQVYASLEAKGYYSASWGQNEYDKTTYYGTDTAIAFKNQTGQDLDKTTAAALNLSIRG